MAEKKLSCGETQITHTPNLIQMGIRSNMRGYFNRSFNTLFPHMPFICRFQFYVIFSSASILLVCALVSVCGAHWCDSKTWFSSQFIFFLFFSSLVFDLVTAFGMCRRPRIVTVPSKMIRLSSCHDSQMFCVRARVRSHAVHLLRRSTFPLSFSFRTKAPTKKNQLASAIG